MTFVGIFCLFPLLFYFIRLVITNEGKIGKKSCSDRLFMNQHPNSEIKTFSKPIHNVCQYLSTFGIDGPFGMLKKISPKKVGV